MKQYSDNPLNSYIANCITENIFLLFLLASIICFIHIIQTGDIFDSIQQSKPVIHSTAVAALPEISQTTPFAKQSQIPKPVSEKPNVTENRFQSHIQEAAAKYEIEPAIIKAIIMVESSFNPKAISKRGARGLMQLMPSTAKSLGVKNSFEPAHNIDGGAKYFKQLLERFNYDMKLALAAYNAGSRNVHKYGGVPPFKETRFYIKKVLQYYISYRDESDPDRV